MFTLKKHILLIATIFILIVGSLTGCKTLIQTPKIGVSTSDTIGMTGKIVDDITAKAEDDGYEIEVYNASGNYETQLSQIGALIESGVNVLAICPASVTDIATGFEAAAAAGIPVVLFERTAEYSGTAFFAGYSAAEEGKAAAQAIVEADNGKSNIVVEIAGPEDNPNAIAASKGFHEVIDLIGNITVIKVYSNWNPDVAYNGLVSVLMRYPDISAIYNSNSTLDSKINDALSFYGLHKKAGVDGHIYRVSVSGSMNGYINTVEGYVDVLIVTSVDDLSGAVYDAIKALGSAKTLESTSFTASFITVPQADVQSNQSSIWGFISNIE